jgi:ubiquinone/menaquinone biosynthesis C-methylase UbiE
MLVLDSGCGAGLETVRLARLVAPSGKVTGIDTSQAFLAEARKRAEGLRLPIEYRHKAMPSGCRSPTAPST